jgi:phosphoribosylformylglycinamidine synthase
MKKPKILIFTGYGLNSEEELKFAFDIAGGEADILHVNDVIANKKLLSKYQIAAFPGGFSFGDDTGSGNAFALKLKNTLWESVEKFVNEDRLMIGICNGCQILVNLGLVPALGKKYGQRQVALLHNTSARYTVRWVDLAVKNQTPWLAGISHISLPIAHGEGKFFADKKTLEEMQKKNLIAAQYVKGEMCEYQSLDANPNGSLADIAAISDETGRVLGIMPHPERAVSFLHLPNWPVIKEQCIRQKIPVPKVGPGMKIFENAIGYFR